MGSWIASAVYITTLYSVVLLVHVICPARLVQGYACDVQTKEPLLYHLNGFRCLCLLFGGFLFLHRVLEQRSVSLFLAQNYGRCAVMSNWIGLLASFYFVYGRSLTPSKAKANRLRRAPTVTTKPQSQPQDLDSRAFPFYWGKEFNPRWSLGSSFLFDVKMFLYLIGAVVLGLNIWSAVLYEQTLRSDGDNSNAILLYAGLFLWFLLDYLWYEEVHLYTYDLFAEKIGFKLLWGCLCFYPFFYPIGIVPFILVDTESATNDLSNLALFAIAILYATGSVFTRGANLQKFYFRQNPEEKTVSLFGGLLVLEQKTVPSSNHRLLCSGFWGLSRHVNYLGEIVQAVALALPAWLYLSSSLWRWLPWLYPIYYVALFIPRQRDDDYLMRQKYGNKTMDEYLQIVPYRMVPGVY